MPTVEPTVDLVGRLAPDAGDVAGTIRRNACSAGTTMLCCRNHLGQEEDVQKFTAMVLVLGASIVLASPVLADGALAIGIPNGNLNKGFVYGMSWDAGLEDAQTKAMNLCKGLDLQNNKVPDRASEAQSACKIMKVFQNKCVAVAMNGDQHTVATGMGWGVAASLDEAKQTAMLDCNGMREGKGRTCAVAGQGCDGNAK